MSHLLAAALIKFVPVPKLILYHWFHELQLIFFVKSAGLKLTNL